MERRSTVPPYSEQVAPTSNDPTPTTHPGPEPQNVSTAQSSITSGSKKIGEASRFSKWSTEWITDWWGMELACWVVAALSLASIVIVLESHKSKPVPEWPFGITINALISILATIGQMAMMKPIVECISQLKWLWFVRKEKLGDFQTIDDASRGPTGSLVLLGKLRGFHLVTLGAAVSVCSLAFGVFAQQIVTYPLRSHPTNGSAATPLALNLTGRNDLRSATAPDAFGFDAGIYASVFNGFTGNGSTLSDISPSCSTGICTWSPYPSLGVCATVLDVSSDIAKNACDLAVLDRQFEELNKTNPGFPCFNYELPFEAINTNLSGLSTQTQLVGDATLSNIPLTKFGMKILAMAPFPGTSNFSFVNAYLIYQPDILESINSPLASPIAYSLSLDLCIQTYNTTVQNGVPKTLLISSQLFNSEVMESFNSITSAFHSIGNPTAMLSVGDIDFGVDIGAFRSLTQLILSVLDSICFFGVGVHSSHYGVVNAYHCPSFSPFSAAFLSGINSSDPLLVMQELSQNVATSLTNLFRSGAVTQIMQFEGTALSPRPFVGTNYFWLLFPLGLVSLTLVFLLATILKSQRLGSRVWKSSNIATLQGLHLDLHTRLGGLSSISEMEENIEKVKVRFDMEGGKAEHGVDYRLAECNQHKYWS